MPIADVLFSKVRAGVLRLLFAQQDERFYLREIAGRIGMSPGPVHRELEALHRAGLICQEQQGRQKFYRANTDCPVFPELRALVQKTVGLPAELAAALSPVAERIVVAFIFGSIARGEETAESDVDLMVVGDVSLREVASAIRPAEQASGRAVNPSVYSAAEFCKISRENHFLRTVLGGPKLFLIGGEDELAAVSG